MNNAHPNGRGGGGRCGRRCSRYLSRSQAERQRPRRFATAAAVAVAVTDGHDPTSGWQPTRSGASHRQGPRLELVPRASPSRFLRAGRGSPGPASCRLPGRLRLMGWGSASAKSMPGCTSNPCHGSTGPADVPVGPTVDELVDALTTQTAYEVSSPTDVTLGGYAGKRTDLRAADSSTRPPGDRGEFYPWAGSIYAQGPDNRWHLWILDIEGDRLVIFSTDFPGTSAADRAEQQAIVDSMRIEP